MMYILLKINALIQNILTAPDVHFTAELAKGKSIYEAVKSKKFISLSIQYTPEIGQGRGPVNHFAYMKKVGLDDE